MSVNSILAAIADRIRLGGDIRRERVHRWSRLFETIGNVVQAAVAPSTVAPTREEIRNMVERAITDALANLRERHRPRVHDPVRAGDDARVKENP